MQKMDFKILIIDDNPEIHNDFIKVLKSNRDSDALADLDEMLFGQDETAPKDTLPDFKIDTASQGQEGVEKIRIALEEKNPYSLAFVDVRMPPGWDGVETIKHIWALDKDVQIVICTAYSDYSWEETVQELGTSDNLLILKKPFDTVSVRQIACALTKKWQLKHETMEHLNFLEQRISERTGDLQNSLSMVRATLESSPDGILVVNNDGEIINHNKNFKKLLNISPSILDSKKSDKVFKNISEQLVEGSTFLEDIKIGAQRNKDNFLKIIKYEDGRIFEYFSHPQKMENEIVGRVWSFRNVTKRYLLEEKLAYQATHDELTGLANRVLLNQKLVEAIQTANRNETIFGVFFFDLDRFKLINDSLSHEAGDQLLKQVASRIKPIVRKNDTFARLGGDEFVFIIQDLPDKDSIIKLAKRMLDTFKEPFSIANREIYVTASTGSSFFPEDGEDVDELLKSSDLAMYQAKGSSSEKFQIYTTDLNQKNLLYFETTNDLRNALSNQEFFLCYQPQFDLETEELLALEALIRWRHPTRGIVPPLDFIPIAEETGLIIPIGEWVLRSVCEQNKKWKDAGFPPVITAVNVAPQQLTHPDFIPLVARVLEETGINPKYLEIELTENCILNNSEAERIIAELKGLGVRISLDDFGTGNSGINHLRKIQIDQLKIDKSFIDNIETNRNDEVIVRAILAMAKSLEFEVIAEGVESKGQMNHLKNQGCLRAQGYFFSKPVSVEEVEKMFKNPAVIKEHLLPLKKAGGIRT